MCRWWRTNLGRLGPKLCLWCWRPDRSRWSLEKCVDVVSLILGGFPRNKSRDWIRCFVSRRCWLGARKRPLSRSVNVLKDGLDAAELGAGVAGVMVM